MAGFSSHRLQHTGHKKVSPYCIPYSGENQHISIREQTSDVGRIASDKDIPMLDMGQFMGKNPFKLFPVSRLRI
jgi:hypothetical protein